MSANSASPPTVRITPDVSVRLGGVNQLALPVNVARHGRVRCGRRVAATCGGDAACRAVRPNPKAMRRQPMAFGRSGRAPWGGSAALWVPPSPPPAPQALPVSPVSADALGRALGGELPGGVHPRARPKANASSHLKPPAFAVRIQARRPPWQTPAFRAKRSAQAVRDIAPDALHR